MASLNDKVRKARNKASGMETRIAASETVLRNADTAKLRLSMAEERAAAKVLRPRMKLDRQRTLARGVAIEKREAKKTAAKRAAAAIGNSPAAKKAVAKKVAKAVVKKKSK
jgi:regulator of protease activity HflC (stomatin/prohibitin superfamily)